MDFVEVLYISRLIKLTAAAILSERDGSVAISHM